MLFFERRLCRGHTSTGPIPRNIKTVLSRSVKAPVPSLFVSRQCIDQQAFMPSPLQPYARSSRPLCENRKQCLAPPLDEPTPPPEGVFFRRFLACLWSEIGLLAVDLRFLTNSDLKQEIRRKRSRSFCPFLPQAAVSIGSTPAADRSARICRKRPGQAVPFSTMTMMVGWTFIS